MGISSLALAGALVLWPSVARADLAAAEALFREGRELMAAGKIAEACHKFSESQRLDPSPGTLVNLARCHAQQGKSASAWAEYLAAKRAAQTAGRSDLAEEAQRQADALVATLSYLTIVAREAVPGLVVDRNGERLEASSLGSKLPVDPGRYTIKASAPGYADYTTEVSVEAGAAAATVTIPPLTPAPDAAAAPAGDTQGPAPAAATESGGPPIVGYVVGGTGIVLTGVGLTFGALAGSKYDDAKQQCPTHTGCSSGAISDRNTAETFANVSNVAVGVGIAAIGVGVVLVLTHHPKRAAQALVIGPQWQPGGAGAFVRGAL